MTPTEKVLITLSIVAISTVFVVRGFANSFSDTLVAVGFPPEVAGNLGALLFFGILVVLLFAGLKTLGKLSRV